MKAPLSNQGWIELEEVQSTQDYLIKYLQEDYKNAPDVVFAWWQKQGRGRFDREWFSRPHTSIAISIAFKDYPDCPRPWLIGMNVAIAAASLLHCKIQWPNDLTLRRKKLGGILTQMIRIDRQTFIPVVGIGINVLKGSFPEELNHKAISLEECRAGSYDLKKMAESLVNKLKEMPEPTSWSMLQPLWMLFDATPGKQYKLPNGEVLEAIGIGSDGELIGSIDREIQTVMAAEALDFLT